MQLIDWDLIRCFADLSKYKQVELPVDLMFDNDAVEVDGGPDEDAEIATTQ